MDAQAVVGGRVADRRGQWTAQGELVLDEQAPPWGHDDRDRLWECLGFAEPTRDIAEEVSDREVDASVMSCVLPPGKKRPSEPRGPPEWETTSRSPVPWMPRSRMSVAALRTMRARKEIACDRRRGPRFVVRSHDRRVRQSR